MRRDANPPDPTATFVAPEASTSLVVAGGVIAAGTGAAPAAEALAAVAAEASQQRDRAALRAALERVSGAK